MARLIPLVTRAGAPLLARPYFEDGDNPLAAALAHVPELLEVAMPFFGVVYGPTALPERLKEIVVLRTSALNGCCFCTRAHATLASATGVDAAEIVRLQHGAPAPSWLAENERAVFDFSEAMCARPAEAVALLKPFFRDDQIVELVLLAATTGSLNRFCTAVGLV